MTNTETVSTENLRHYIEYDELVGPNATPAISSGQLASLARELLASRNQEPAEWQVEAAARVLVPVWYGGFEDQTQKEEGGWLHPPGTPNKRALDTARAALRAASIPAPERSKEETDAWIDSIMGQAIDAYHAEAGTTADWDGVKSAIKVAVSALETPPLHKEGEAEYVTVDHKGCIFHSKDMDGIARIAKANLEAAVAAAAPAPVPVTITPEMIERAAIGIYEEAPSIGLDCECGWRDQTPQYKQKARMIARAALTAALSKPGEQG